MKKKYQFPLRRIEKILMVSVSGRCKVLMDCGHETWTEFTGSNYRARCYRCAKDEMGGALNIPKIEKRLEDEEKG